MLSYNEKQQLARVTITELTNDNVKNSWKELMTFLQLWFVIGLK